MKSDVVVYEPNQRLKIGFFKSWVIMFMNIISSRELIWQLFKRDFFAVYKKSFLGIAWVFLTPIIGIVSWVFMNMTGILNPGDVGIPYPAYVLISSSIWGLFVKFFQSASQTLNSGAGFIMQVKFSHESLLIKQIAEQLAQFVLSFTFSIIVLLAFGVVPSWKIIFLPLGILPLFLLAGGIGLVVSVVGAVAMDMTKIFTFLFGLLMYLTPVIYSPNTGNELLQNVIKWNPLTYLIGTVRDMIIYGKVEHFDRFLISSVLSLVIFFSAWRLFFVSEEKVIEKMI